MQAIAAPAWFFCISLKPGEVGGVSIHQPGPSGFLAFLVAILAMAGQPHGNVG